MAGTTLPPLVAIAAEHGAGGDLVAPRVAEALGAPFVDRGLPTDPEQLDSDPAESAALPGRRRCSALRRWSALTSTRAAREPSWPSSLPARRGTGGVVLGRRSMVVLAGAPRAVHVFLTGPSEGRVDRVAAREGVARDEARRRGGRA